MSYIWFYVHGLAEHVRKSSICQINRLAGLTVRNPGEEANIIFKLLFQYRLPVLIKKKHYPTHKMGENDLYSILGALAGRARPEIG